MKCDNNQDYFKDQVTLNANVFFQFGSDVWVPLSFWK